MLFRSIYRPAAELLSALGTSRMGMTIWKAAGHSKMVLSSVEAKTDVNARRSSPGIHVFTCAQISSRWGQLLDCAIHGPKICLLAGADYIQSTLLTGITGKIDECLSLWLIFIQHDQRSVVDIP